MIWAELKRLERRDIIKEMLVKEFIFVDTKLKLIMEVYVYSDRYLSFRKQYVKNSSCINKICNFWKSQSTQDLKSRDPIERIKKNEKISLLEALKIKKDF